MARLLSKISVLLLGMAIPLGIVAFGNTQATSLTRSSTQYFSHATAAPYTEIVDGWTLETWFFTRNLAAADTNYGLIQTATGENCITLGYNSDSDTTGRMISFGGNTTCLQASGAADEIEEGKWYHVAYIPNDTASMIVHDQSGKLIINTGYNVNPSPNAKTATVNIGNTGPGNEIPDGSMDEVRVWNYARTVAEIERDMFCELTGKETGLQFYLKFNDTAGAANDSTGNTTPWTNNNTAPFVNGVPFEKETCTGSSGIMISE